MKIVLIGSGNVATHIGKAIATHRDFPISQVISKTKVNAKSLADKLKAAYSDRLEDIIPNADLYILAIHDDSIQETGQKIKKFIAPSSCIIHTSGSISASVFADLYQNYGVLYPLQSFTKTKKMVYTDIPFFIIGSTKNVTRTLQSLASSISKKVMVIKDKDKALLHIAAVFANNFSNAMLDISYQLLEKHQIPFEYLMPLMEETIAKLKVLSPLEAQTGPAKRNDQNVLSSHQTILKSENKDWLTIYEVITAFIIKRHKSK